MILGLKNLMKQIKEEIRIGEIGEIIETLQEKAGQEADIIWGNGYDDSLGDNISVTILATGFVQNPNQTQQKTTFIWKYIMLIIIFIMDIISCVKFKKQYRWQRKQTNQMIIQHLIT